MTRNTTNKAARLMALDILTTRLELKFSGTVEAQRRRWQRKEDLAYLYHQIREAKRS